MRSRRLAHHFDAGAVPDRGGIPAAGEQPRDGMTSTCVLKPGHGVLRGRGPDERGAGGGANFIRTDPHMAGAPLYAGA